MERYALLLAAGYLIGSTPFGLYVSRYGRGGPSAGPANGNVAPLDLYRRSGPARRLVGLAFILELAKGFVPTLTGYVALGTPGAVGGGSAVLVGHNFPLFARLRGSNSLAPLLGVLLAVYPLVVVILGMVGTAALSAWRYASLAALVAAVVSPFALAALDAGGDYEGLVVLAAVLWSLLTFLAHRENIRRLVSGREARINAPALDGRGEARRGGRRVR
ncbi:MAG: glycerol-3-phosphate acyltransferase [Actinomycetota bacterium]|nr:glycerol-3-phosphate acyltransferase [Actinomycetota bacterium]